MCDAINVSRTRIYRFIEKEDIKPVNDKVKTKLYDEQAQSLIFQHFTGNSDIHISGSSDNSDNKDNTANNGANNNDDELITLLKTEITNKNNEIATLHRLLDQQQQLDLANAKLISSYRDTTENDSENTDNNYSRDSDTNSSNDNNDTSESKQWWHFW